jgi:phage I-like protein
MLLPLDQKELVDNPVVQESEYGLSLAFEAEERVYTLDRLCAIEASTLALFAAQEAKGARAKGLPVSYMHEIEMRLQGQPTKGTLERAGTIYDVHVADGLGQEPGGLYALVEWTNRAFEQIESGEWHDLSIALATDYRIADGTVIAGECMFAAALVDVGFFEAIPSARDGLPLDAFSRPTAETVAMYRRSVQRQLYERETMNVKLRMDDAMLEQIKAVVGDALSEHVEMLHSMHEKLCAMDEQMSKTRDMSAAGELEEDEEGAEEAAEEVAEEVVTEAKTAKAATATTTLNSSNSAEAMAARVASKVAPYGEAKIAETVQGHVESGRLLPAHVRAYALALAKGERDVAEAMLGDFTGLSSRSGSGIAASVATRDAVTTKTAAQIISDLESEGKLRKGTQSFVTEMYRRITKAREAGILV